MSESPEDNPTFEQSLAGLEQVVRELEDGQLGLEDALARYERGVGLLKRCYAQLRDAEQRILLVTGADAEGKPLTKPVEASITDEPGVDKAKPRRRKSGEADGMFS